MSPPWVPDVEVYCPMCCRMVGGTLDGRTSTHYRFNMRGDQISQLRDDAALCRGAFRTDWSGMTHGMEDPAAAFLPTEPDAYPETEATAPSVAVPDRPADPAPGAGHRFGFWMVRSST